MCIFTPLHREQRRKSALMSVVKDMPRLLPKDRIVRYTAMLSSVMVAAKTEIFEHVWIWIGSGYGKTYLKTDRGCPLHLYPHEGICVKVLKEGAINTFHNGTVSKLYRVFCTGRRYASFLAYIEEDTVYDIAYTEMLRTNGHQRRNPPSGVIDGYTKVVNNDDLEFVERRMKSFFGKKV